MKQILVFGAGRSSVYLIAYLGKYCEEKKMRLLVCDKDIAYAKKHVTILPSIEYRSLDIADEVLVSAMLKESALVVSLLPAALHIHIARLCLALGISLATASYVSEVMQSLHDEAADKGLIFLNEMGLDPGIDHMSAMMMMDKIRSEGGNITGFKSYCGGLVADEDDGDNPWKYKFSWNPRNVVLAGQGTPALYIENGVVKLSSYVNIFRNPIDVEIFGYGNLEAYPNRDSLHYIRLYGLEGIREMLRGTLRKPGFCKAWQVLLELGMTDDTQVLNFASGTTFKDWVTTYLPNTNRDLKSHLLQYCHCTEDEWRKLEWLGLFSDEVLPVNSGTSAAILEAVLKNKWELRAKDRDLVVMKHEIIYEISGTRKMYTAGMVLKGESNTNTAMAKTVGLPLAIGCRLILEGKIPQRGVVIPLYKELYLPVMEELKTHGIYFEEAVREMV